MNVLPDPMRIVGALRFLAELSAVGAEFAASPAAQHEPAARRLREDSRVAAWPAAGSRRGRNQSETLAVKAR
jgi:hypothetical protein